MARIVVGTVLITLLALAVTWVVFQLGRLSASRRSRPLDRSDEMPTIPIPRDTPHD